MYLMRMMMEFDSDDKIFTEGESLCSLRRVKLLPLLGSDLGLNVLHCPPILLLLCAHHPKAGLDTLSLPRGVQSCILPDKVLIFVFIVCLWCNFIESSAPLSLQLLSPLSL